MRMGIYLQIAMSMTCAATIVGFLIAGYERRVEVARMNAELLAQADLTVSLISGLMIETIIVQDTPVLETAMEQALARNKNLLALTIRNDVGDVIAHVTRVPLHDRDYTLNFKRDIIVDGISFGTTEVDWSTAEGQALIDAKVGHTRNIIFLAILALSILFILQIYILIMRPLKNIHQRMRSVIKNLTHEKRPISVFASHEFHALDNSVDVLSTTLMERDDREKLLTAERERADRANRAKSDFLANMSHEIRTPMNGVIGMAALLLETNLDDTQKLYADTISSSGAALLGVISDILNFSKIEAGKTELDLAPFDLQATLCDVVNLLSANCDTSSVEIMMRFHPELPTEYIGDAGKLRQVLTNIIGNAIKFTPSGYIYVNVKRPTGAEQSTLQIEVTDTGIGIPEERINSVFQAFEQIESARNRRFEGTGLGLAISTQLLALMNGKLHVRSEIGVGSTFSLELPLTPTCGRKPNGNNLDLKGTRVLVVDDQEINRAILSELLLHWGMVPELASSGAEAINILAQKKSVFDLLICDYQMPEMSGEELALQTRKLPPYAQTPLLLLSSIDQTADKLSVTKYMPCEVFGKPIQPKMLCVAIERSLQIQSETDLPRDPAKSSLQNTSKLNILVAEDNKTNQLIVKKMLAGMAASVTIAKDGREALHIFSEGRPDLIFMDISMPEMDGLQATRAIRKLEGERNTPRCPIVALTANASGEDEQKCMSAGMDGFLTKPINKAALASMIQNWATPPPNESDGL